jgi:hypothetical protein
MKAPPWLLLYSATSLFTSTALAQPQPSVAPTIETSPITIVEIGDHHRVWQSVTTETDEEGNVTYRTNSYTELETGMNVKQPDGSYVEASDEIEITATGGVAQKTRHQVTFAGNCNTAVAIDLLAADGKRFQSHVLGLSYLDTATGQSVVIAEVKDSGGQLMASKNEVVYFDAFTDVRGNISYQNSKSGLEQNIILTGRPPVPAAFNLNKETVVLQVLTEFVAAPEPQKQQTTDSVGRLVDLVLNFADLSIGSGRALAVGAASDQSIPVRKYWGHPSGRTILIEEVDYTAIEPLLNTLTASAEPSLKNSPDGVLHTVSATRLLPPVKVAKNATQPMKLASAPLGGNGVVLDYSIASSTNNYTFKGDTTYYVSGAVNLSGTTTIEGGTVIKYTNQSSATLSMSGSLVCQTGPYRPAVFTSKDDDTVGDTITGSTGSPVKSTVNVYLQNNNSGSYKYLRFAYAGTAINDEYLNEVRHCQFLDCNWAIRQDYHYISQVVLRNILFVRCSICVKTYAAVSAEHLTVDACTRYASVSAGSIYLTNSLVTASLLNAGSFLYNSQSFSSSNGIYQTVGAASYYLADNSPYRNAGTTNITASLLAELKKKTTYPPILLNNTVLLDTTLNPQAQRDTDDPDLGYHYDPIDYITDVFTVTNATLTVTDGTAVAFYTNSTGIWLQYGGSIISVGTPLAPNWFVPYSSVQEQSLGSSSGTSVNPYHIGSPNQTAVYKFSNLFRFAGQGTQFIDANSNWVYSSFLVQDCQVWNGVNTLGGGDSSAAIIANNLFYRSTFSAFGSFSNSNFALSNNLFVGLQTRVILRQPSGAVWYAFNNVFDTCLLGAPATCSNGDNAYINSTNRISPTNVNDIVSTNALGYQSGTLGDFYQPTNSPLINAGSVTNAALAGFYHYTTTTNQVKEANTPLDIGFHYVATDTNGIPIDTNGDGVPDYLEDANGNGQVDSGEIGWNIFGDLGLKVLITRPKNNSTIP